LERLSRGFLNITPFSDFSNAKEKLIKLCEENEDYKNCLAITEQLYIQSPSTLRYIFNKARYCKLVGKPQLEADTKLQDILDLSEVEELDFSILVTKWPGNGPFFGNMDLRATQANFRECNVN